MKKGIVIGKFYPPHRGHKYLIDTALSQVDQLTVIVCHAQYQKIHGEQRAAWLREIHPKAKVIVVDDIGKDDDSQAWAEYTKKFLGYTPDVVFTSEEYGINYAKYLGCEHVLVDLERLSVPISATKIRDNPIGYIDFLEPMVRADFIKRICIVGAESTGTTTLSQDLARHYETVWAPEFGRFYTESKLSLTKDIWISEDFEYIAATQNSLEDILARQVNKLLICDTNSLATEIWHDRYMGYMSEKIREISKNRKYDMYFVTGDEIPFVQDGLRDGEHIRHPMHDRFVQILEQRSIPFVLLRGNQKERLSDAIKICDKILETSSGI